MSRTTKKKEDKKKKKDKDISISSDDQIAIGDWATVKLSEYDPTQYDNRLLTLTGEEGITIDQIASMRLSPNMPLEALLKGDPSIISSYIATPSTTLSEQIELQDEITKLKRELGSKIEELNEVKEDKEKKEAKRRKLTGKQQELLK